MEVQVTVGFSGSLQGQLKLEWEASLQPAEFIE